MSNCVIIGVEGCLNSLGLVWGSAAVIESEVIGVCNSIAHLLTPWERYESYQQGKVVFSNFWSIELIS